MKIIDKLKDILVGNIYVNEEIDVVMEGEKYYPVESDDEQEEGVLKYSNGKSQMWIKYIRENQNYLVSDVTLSTKKKGKTATHAFKNVDDIKKMMDYFRNNKQHDDFLTFVLGLFLARRIGDTLSLKWSDFFYDNGRKKETLNTLIEQKTDKMIDVQLTDITWKYVDWYCEQTGINPVEHLEEDIFKSKHKENLSEGYTKEEYAQAVEKQESAYRYQFKKAAHFNGIEGVSTHSTRKTFVYIAHQINKFDPDNWEVLKTITGHESIETLKIYSDIMDEKGKKMYNDVGKYIHDIDNGVTPVIENIPVVSLQTNDMRDALIYAYNRGKNSNSNESEMEIMSELLGFVEEKKLSL